MTVVVVIFSMLLFYSCSSIRQSAQDDVTPLSFEPEAESEHNDSYRGVYKGVLTTTDSSGMFDLSIKNRDDETILLSGTYNGTPFSLSGNETYEEEEEEYRYEFSGISDGEEYSISFSTEIGLSGTVDKGNTTFRADGNEVHVNMFKETSDRLVRVYEGTYSGGSSGKWNYILRGTEISGYYAGDGEGEFSGKLVPAGESGVGFNGEDDAENLSGTIFVWGENGDMLARGRVNETKNNSGDEETFGLWLYDENGNYSESTPESRYPLETKNRWKGERTL